MLNTTTSVIVHNTDVLLVTKLQHKDQRYVIVVASITQKDKDCIDGAVDVG